MRSSPPLTGETAAIIRIVEDLPAPLGPRKPNASPRRTSTSMPRTASKSPNDLRSPRAEIIRSSAVACSGTSATVEEYADTAESDNAIGSVGGIGEDRGVQTHPAPVTLPDADDFADWLDARCADGLAAARDAVRRLKAGEATTPEQALQIWDDGMVGMGNAASRRLAVQRGPPRRVRPRRAARPPSRRCRGSAPSSSSTASCTTCSPPSTPPRSTRRPPACSTRPSPTSGVPASTATTQTRDRITEINEQLTLRRPGVQQEHPRRQAHHPGRPRAARRPAAGLARRPPRRATTAWSPSPPTTPTPSRCAPSARTARSAARWSTRSSTSAGPTTTRSCASCSSCARSSPGCSATTPGPTTTPRSR